LEKDPALVRVSIHTVYMMKGREKSVCVCR
jgi:hypothetical protein